MAIDEALLESAISHETATLRWYEWDQPTVSLGYFQKIDDLKSLPRVQGLPVVRRLSGGGAILHDDELTYSISLPASQRLFTQPHELYDIIHDGISLRLNACGIPAVARGTSDKVPEEPLLCFQRKDSHDVTVDGKKILGSAQRRRRGAIMEHGSLIRRTSAYAPSIVGMLNLREVVLPSDFTKQLAETVANLIAVTWEFGTLTVEEATLADQLRADSYERINER